MSEEDIPNLVDCEDDDDGSDGWDEMDTTTEQTTCLFCPSQFHTIAVALDHCRTEHGFNLLELKNKYNMDCYSFIKMINYVRIHRPEPHDLKKGDVPVWNDDEYLKPGVTESWLMYDFDDLGSTPSTPNNTIDAKDSANTNFMDLQRTIQELALQLREKDALLQTVMEDMSKMRRVTRTLVENSDGKADGDVLQDEGYFGSYAHFGIHHEMLSDRVRTESYRDAIIKNGDLFKGKIVLDLGCGTGILSMFSASAGAEKVIGIDQSEIVYQAMDIVRENNFTDKIHLMRGKLENTALPEEKVDVIISEWMGYFLLFEGMLDSVIYARDNLLASNGIVLPNKCVIYITGCSDIDKHNKLIGFWDDVYGYSMKCFKDEVVREASIDIVPSENIITSASPLVELDMMTCTTQSVNFISEFTLNVVKDGPLTALVGYFDTHFTLPHQIMFSTGPLSDPTHWKQTLFYLKEPLECKTGDSLSGKLVCKRHHKDARSLSVSIRIAGREQNYSLD